MNSPNLASKKNQYEIILDKFTKYPVTNDVDRAINIIFFEKHNPSIITLNFKQETKRYSICYEYKCIVISQQDLIDFFIKKDFFSKEKSKNYIYFCSKEAQKVFNSNTSNKFTNIDKKSIQINNLLSGMIKSNKLQKLKIDEDKIVLLDSIFAFFIAKSCLECQKKRNKEINFINSTIKELNANDFIRLYNKTYINIEEEHLYTVKTIYFDNKNEKHNLNREISIYKRFKIQNPFRLDLIGFYIIRNEKFIVYDFIDGNTLKSVIEDLKLTEKATIIMGIMIAIEELHLNKIIYRDLKPDNVIIDENKSAIIIDYEYATLNDQENATITADVGSLYFSAPESFSSGFYYYESDIFSIGKMIHYILTGKNDNGGPEIPREYRIFNSIYAKCTNENFTKRPKITKLINEFYIKILNHFKSTISSIVEKDEKERIEGVLKNIYNFRVKEIEQILVNESKEYRQEFIDQIVEILEFFTYFNYEEQQEALKNIFAKFKAMIYEYEDIMNPNSLYFIGLLYYEGKFFDQDIIKSISYFTQSAEQNNSKAQYQLGIEYLLGTHINKDINKAIEYLEKSSNNNYSEAQYQLGKIYEEGSIVTKDLDKSIEYYTLSAKQNHLNSQLKVLENFVLNSQIIQNLNKKYNDNALLNIYKKFTFHYSKNINIIDENIDKMKPFSMIDILYHEKNKNIIVICCFKHCYIIETETALEKIIEIFQDNEYFNGVKFFTTREEYSNLLNQNEDDTKDMKAEVESFFKYFQVKDSILCDFYFDNIEEYFINVTIKPIIGFTIRKFFYPSKYFNQKTTNVSISQNHREFDEKDFIYLRQIGKGSFSTVLLCYHLETEKLYALKKYSESNELNIYYKREKYFYEHSKNEFIVKYYGYISNKNIFVLEFMSQGSLTSKYYSNVSASERIKIILSILLGIKYTHSINYVHRDLKPLNVFIDSNNEYFLGDFSCVKYINDNQNNDKDIIFNSKTTCDIGSYHFSCPHADFSGEEKDMYSLGLIFKELITIKTKDESPKEQHIIAELSIYETELNEIIQHCLNKNQSNKYIIIMIFYLFEAFIQKKDKAFIKKFYKTYRHIFEYFIQPNENNTTVYHKKSDIDVIIDYFEHLSQSLSENKSTLSYIYWILGDIFYKEKSIPINVNKSIDYFEYSSELNNSKAQYNLGIIYYEGDHVQRDINKSISYLSRSAEQNNSEALYNLGVIYLEGKYVAKDFTKAMDYFRQASNGNNSGAQFNLGMIYYEDQIVERDINKAIHYLTLAAEKNHIIAQINLGNIYYTSKYISPDINKSIYYLTLASDQNDSEAQCFLGTIYFKGILIDIDIRKSIHYFTLSANQNNSEAQFYLGFIYYYSDNNFSNKEKGIYYFTLSANQNNSKAQYYLGLIYFNVDVQKSIKFLQLSASQNNSNALLYLGILYILNFFDINKSIYFFKLSADLNNSYAQMLLGLIFYGGKHVERDINKAIYYLTLSANLNNSYAQMYLGSIFYEGKYVKMDINKAIYYLKLSANQNNSIAQFRLGIIYYYIEKDLDKSIYYFTLSADNGNSEAQIIIGVRDYCIEMSIEKSIKYLQLSADQNNSDAFYFLGQIYFDRKDINKSIHYFTLSANQNNQNAQFFLGYIYYIDEYIPQDINKSIHYFTLSANQNNQNAQFFLGYIYYIDEYIPQDINKSIHYLTLSACQNNQYAQYLLGEIYYNNKYKSYDLHKSIYYLEQSAEQNNPYALFLLGEIYLINEDIKHDFNKSIYYFTKSAKLNCVKAQTRLGEIYYTGIITPRDIYRSIYYLELASNQNNSFAQYLLGEIYYNGKFDKPNIDKSIYYLTLAAKQNNANAWYLLGKINYERKYISGDINKAIYYFILAANNFNHNAQYLLGKIYYEGELVKQDIEKSIYYLTLAAKQDNANAWYLLGEIYYTGKYIPTDINKSIHYLTLASEKTKYNARFLLGEIYYEGIYVPKDYRKAIYYFKESSNLYANYAKNNLGVMYQNGYGVEQNTSKAIEYFEESIKQDNDKYSLYNLSRIYYFGLKNTEKSIEKLQIASSKEFFFANLFLFYLYLYDSDIKDITKAYFYKNKLNNKLNSIGINFKIDEKQEKFSERLKEFLHQHDLLYKYFENDFKYFKDFMLSGEFKEQTQQTNNTNSQEDINENFYDGLTS